MVLWRITMVSLPTKESESTLSSANPSGIPALNDAQLLKLKHLTLVSLALRNRVSLATSKTLSGWHSVNTLSNDFRSPTHEIYQRIRRPDNWCHVRRSPWWEDAPRRKDPSYWLGFWAWCQFRITTGNRKCSRQVVSFSILDSRLRWSTGAKPTVLC